MHLTSRSGPAKLILIRLVSKAAYIRCIFLVAGIGASSGAS